MIPELHGASRSRRGASLSHALHPLGSKERPALRPEPPAAHEASDSERRLEQELSQLLSRRPVRSPDHQSSPNHSYAEIEPDEPLPRTVPFVGPHAPSQDGADAKAVDAATSAASEGPSDDGSAGDDAATHSESSPRPTLDPDRTNWFRAARRARRNRRLRFVGSWLITILVGGFIVSIAAMILFGMPVGKFAVQEQQTRQAANEDIMATPGRMAASRTRWHLN